MTITEPKQGGKKACPFQRGGLPGQQGKGMADMVEGGQGTACCHSPERRQWLSERAHQACTPDCMPRPNMLSPGQHAKATRPWAAR